MGDWANRMGSWRDRDLRGIEERVGLIARSDDGSSSAIGVADSVRHAEIDDDGLRGKLSDGSSLVRDRSSAELFDFWV